MELNTSTNTHTSSCKSRIGSQTPRNHSTETSLSCTQASPKEVMRLHQNDINIFYKKDIEMMLTNTLSRHHLEHTTDKAQGDEQVDSLETINEIFLCESTVAALRDHMLRDIELQQVQSFIHSDSPH